MTWPPQRYFKPGGGFPSLDWMKKEEQFLVWEKQTGRNFKWDHSDCGPKIMTIKNGEKTRKKKKL